MPRVETSLREERNVLSAILDTVGALVVVLDPQGRIVRFNRACEQVTGYALAEVAGQSFTDMFIPPEECAGVSAIVAELLAGQNFLQHENHWLLRDGGRRLLSWSNTVLHNPDGTIKYLIGCGIDITEQRQAERRLQDEMRQRQAYSQELEAQKAELERANAALQNLATTDGLTGLKNHRAFQEQFESEFERAMRYSLSLSVMMIDVDHFKKYNDTYGHPAGDEVLKTVATCLQTLARHTDFVARYGGEEFVVVLPNTDAAGALNLAERFRHGVESHAWPYRPVTISLGVASYTEETPGRAQLLAEADAAIYRSKQNGRNCVLHYSVPMDALAAV